jgi:hypothetical protein
LTDVLAKMDSEATGAPSQLWPAERPASPKRIGRSPLYRQFLAVFEGVVLLVALVAFERLFLTRGAYASLDLHPFWLPVLLVSMQHGLFGGVVTACLAALVSDWPIRAPGLDIADYYFELVRLPVQWLLVAMALGVFRQGQIRAEEARVREIARLQEVNDSFAEEVARLDDELWRFELSAAIAAHGAPDRVACGSEDAQSATATVAQTLTRLAELRASGPAEVGVRFAECARAVLGDAAVRLFRATGSGGYSDVSPGAPLGSLSSTLPPDHPVVRAAVGPESRRLRRGPRSDVLAIAVRPAPGVAPVGLIAAVVDTRGPAGAAREEALRLLTDAAAAGLTDGKFGAGAAVQGGGTPS